MFWDELKYDDKGLVCAVFQDWQSGEVLTLAWMNREAIEKTWQEKQVWLLSAQSRPRDDERRAERQRADRERDNRRLRSRCAGCENRANRRRGVSQRVSFVLLFHGR